MSLVIIRPGDLDVVDPSGSKVYAFDWDTDNLAVGATIVDSTFAITGLNAIGAALNLAVASVSYLDPNITITTAAPHGLSTGTYVTLGGVLPAEYNRTAPAVVTGATTLTIGFGGLAALISFAGATLTRGLDQTSILSVAPYSSRWAQFRFTPPAGSLGALFAIENRIVTSESVSQAKPKSFEILVQNQ